MRLFLPVALLLMLAACTGIDTYYNACTDAYHTIEAQVSCVKANVAQNSMLQDDPLTQEFIRTGDVLVKRVAAGKLSEDEAQLRFVQALNNLRQQGLREQAYQAQIDRANRDMFPRQTQCEKGDDGKLYCTTY